ncbi:hypothetical protein [Oceaniglobus indicus]|uniref:hypothetical protein n=1 Tax=Oceaniglobus indicus TaxID=2047749 RepID=UPI000C174BD5|nr:hypothetical protein [Oceaniglobus indicus]
MAIDQTDGAAPTSHSLLREAQAHYAAALEDMVTLRQYLKDADILPEVEMKRVIGNYARATQTLFDERKKLEELDKRNKGIVHEHAIDFDALRVEIGSRLDRLRAVAGPVGVSAEPDR